MTDLLKNGSDWLAEQMLEHASATVTYHRDGNSVELSATVGRTIFEIVDGAGVLERVESRDFFIEAASLVLDGSETLPERGDRIKETQGATVYVYKVMAPRREPSWRYSDSHRKLLRIHTKQVDTE